MQASSSPVIFSANMEQIAAGEIQAIEELEGLFKEMAEKVASHEGHAFRAVHAKGQALIRGYLEIQADLSGELKQGLFAQPGRYEALLRLSSPPAEQLPDSVSTPRALALKVLQVPGEHLPDLLPSSSQDFLMVNGARFSAPDPGSFLKSVKLLAATTEKMPRTKKVISALLRGAEATLEAVGGESGKLKGLGGEPQHHPLGETYFTQVPFLYGPYIAKFSLRPLSQQLLDLTDLSLESSEDAQRAAINRFIEAIDVPVQWDLRVQLCRDIDAMPIEDASVEWSEDLSPWQSVATLSVSRQSTWTDQAQETDDELAFAPWNALEAHRPLGGVNRARRIVMAASRSFRSDFNRCPIHEPSAK